MYLKVLVTLSCLTVWDSMDCSPVGSSLHGIFRQEYWSGLPFPSPRNLPDPGIEPGSPALQADSLPSEPSGKPYNIHPHFSFFVFLPPSLSPSLPLSLLFLLFFLSTCLFLFLSSKKLQPREVGDIGAKLYTEPWPHGRGGIWSPTSPSVVWEMPGLDPPRVSCVSLPLQATES